MSRLGRFILIACIAAALAPVARADEPAGEMNRRAVLRKALADFETAVATGRHNTDEAQALYHSALAGFESLVRDGVRNGRLYYNLANAHLRLGDVGGAIVNYKRALEYMPGDAQIQKNLEFARKLCEVRFRKPATSALVETLLFWHFETSTAARSRFALAAYCLFWLLAIGGMFLPRRIPAMTWLTVTVAAVTIAVGASAVWDLRPTAHREGVLVSDDVVVRKGNGAYYDPQFEKSLPPGVEFELLEVRKDVDGEDWFRIRLSDGKDGWIPAHQAELV